MHSQIGGNYPLPCHRPSQSLQCATQHRTTEVWEPLQRSVYNLVEFLISDALSSLGSSRWNTVCNNLATWLNGTTERCITWSHNSVTQSAPSNCAWMTFRHGGNPNAPSKPGAFLQEQAIYLYARSASFTSFYSFCDNQRCLIRRIRSLKRGIVEEPHHFGCIRI